MPNYETNVSIKKCISVVKTCYFLLPERCFMRSWNGSNAFEKDEFYTNYAIFTKQFYTKAKKRRKSCLQTVLHLCNFCFKSHLTNEVRFSASFLFRFRTIIPFRFSIFYRNGVTGHSVIVTVNVYATKRKSPTYNSLICTIVTYFGSFLLDSTINKH